MKKRILSFVLSLALILPFLPATAKAADGGTLSSNVFWELTGSTLTVRRGPNSTGAFTFYHEPTVDEPTLKQLQNTVKTVIIEDGITAIDRLAFFHWTQLEYVIIPSTVKVISFQAFFGCTSLDNVTIPSGCWIYGSAFQNCTGLTNLTLEEGVRFGSSSEQFRGCIKLKSLVIPASMASKNDPSLIPANAPSSQDVDYEKPFSELAFAECTGLERVAFREGGTIIGMGMFYGCTSLTTVDFPSTLEAIVTHEEYRNVTAIRDEEGNTSEGIKPFYRGAFSNCTSLEEITLPEGLQEIGDQAFFNTIIEHVDIPKSVTSIGSKAFGDKEYLSPFTSVRFEGDPPQMSKGGNSSFFTTTTSVLELMFPFGNDKWDAVMSISDPFFSQYGDDRWLAYGAPEVKASLTVEISESVDESRSTITKKSELNMKALTIPFDIDRIKKSAYYVGGITPPDEISDGMITNMVASPISDQAVSEFTMCWEEKTVSSRAVTETTEQKTLTLAGSIFITEYDEGQGSIPTYICLGTYDDSPYELAECWDKNFDFDITVKTTSDLQEIVTPPPQGGGTEGGGDPPVTPSTPSTPSTTTTTSTTTSSDDTDNDSKTTQAIVELLPPEVVAPPEETVESSIQGIVKLEEEPVKWIERIEPPPYALELYDVLVAGADEDNSASSQLTDCFIDDSCFIIDPNTGLGEPQIYEVVQAEELTFSMLDPYAGDVQGLTSMIFENDSFNIVDVSSSDKTINYSALQLGDVVRTATFNGVYVTRVPVDDAFDQQKKEICSYIGTVFHAFDRDHPEVFWLSGRCKVRMLTVRSVDGGNRFACFFMTLADKDGFTMRSPDWTEPGKVAEGLYRRDKAVAEILAAVTAETPSEQMRQLNRWLTEHNEYNTTPDLTTIGNEPHECLSALEGRTGLTGPVCDGYSRAFKVLCDQLGIPCVLENGYARPTEDSAGTFHMWNSAQAGTEWYGVDVTWNDPTVKGVNGAKSGRENENFLLVGAETMVRGMMFSFSHPATNQAAEGGVSFSNSPTLSAVAFSVLTANSGLTALPFTDVPDQAWYAGAVEYVYNNGLMSGVSSTLFNPNGTVTRAQAVVILHRMGRLPSAPSASYADVPDGLWYTQAVNWASANGIASGYGDGRFGPGNPITREQLAMMLYRFAGSPDSSGLPLDFPDADAASDCALDALRWAVKKGLISGTKEGLLIPKGWATRAQAAAILERFHRISSKT